MESIKNAGLLITIEGIEGSGKSTLARVLADKLSAEGLNVILTAEPGGDPIAESIRSLLLRGNRAMDPKTELFLFMASRAQLVSNVIKPHIEHGGIVVCDRYTDSTLVYQGCGRGFDTEWLRQLNDFATGGLVPDLTILLDLPVEIGLKRQEVSDRIGGEPAEFHEAVRKGYLKLAETEPKRFAVIDASADAAVVEKSAIAEISRRLPQLKII